jgi:hypothetical protein
MNHFSTFSIAILTLSAAACSGPFGGIPEPAKHRSEAGAMCDDFREPGSTPTAEEVAFASCSGDDDCSEGDNGRCVTQGRGGYWCTYDECYTDDDCGDGNVCTCGGDHGANHCLQGNCQVDADCGDNSYCSPSFGTCGNYTGVVGYFCHTRKDKCSNDTDCDGEGEFGEPYCMYDTTVGHWRCSSSQCVG